MRPLRIDSISSPEEKGKLAPGNYLVQVHRGSDLLAGRKLWNLKQKPR